ncbi:predicted protein [Coccidioides posadasii str. Silveira]|uniref:Predicted protein n=1 Tax=Coccidioides posadasii (strain RMSCC 757 / Silveira) TaxID=443226 RepID=E9DCW5_COCPS|nr:predicted protein [Coccidioides posadasii str. Silveira]
MLYDADKLSLLEAYNQLKCENNMYKAINYKSGLAYEANVEPGDYLADRIRSDKVENFTEKRRIGNKVGFDAMEIRRRSESLRQSRRCCGRKMPESGRSFTKHRQASLSSV